MVVFACSRARELSKPSLSPSEIIITLFSWCFCMQGSWSITVVFPSLDFSFKRVAWERVSLSQDRADGEVLGSGCLRQFLSSQYQLTGLLQGHPGPRQVVGAGVGEGAKIAGRNHCCFSCTA